MNDKINGKQDNAGKIWTITFITLILVSLIDSGSLQALSNVTPLYVDHMAGSATLSGFLATIFSLAGGVGRLTGGYLSDTKGRRRIMMTGLAMLAVGAMLPGICYNVALLVIARALQGVGFAITATAAGGAVADILPKEKMGEGIGYYALGQSLASALGPAFGIWLASGGNFKMVFSVLVATALAGCVLAATCNYEKKNTAKNSAGEAEIKAETKKEDAGKEPLISRIIEVKAIPSGLMNLTIALGTAAYMNFLSLYGKSLRIDNIGTFFTVSAVVMIICRVFLSKYLDKINPKLIIITTMGIGFISFMIVAFLTMPVFFYIAGALYGFFFGIIFPYLNVLAVKDVPQHKRGAATATCYIGADLGMGIGGTVCGFLIDHVGFQNMFIINSGWMIVTMIIGLAAVSVGRGKRKEKAANEG